MNPRSHDVGARPRRLHWERTLLLVAVASGLAALWMTIHRDEGYVVRCVRAIDLYQVAEVPRVSGLAFEPSGRLTIELEGLDESRWRPLGEGAAAPVIEGRNPVVPLAPGLSQTVLQGLTTGYRLEFRTQWAPGQAEPLVSFGPLRIGAASPYSIHDFVIPVDAHPVEQIEAARQLLEPLALEEVGEPEKRTPDLDRVARLAAFLHHQLEPHRGVPDPDMARRNGYAQYQEAVAGRAEVYCANHAEIFAFMANVAALPTRIVDLAGRVDDVAVGAHTFNETYIARDGRWAYVDLQLGLAGVFDASGRFLSAGELVTRIRQEATADLSVRLIRDGEIVVEPYRAHAHRIETFLTRTASLVYLSSEPDRFAPLERIKRLLFAPRPAICDGGLPDRLGRRLAATWLSLGAAGIWLVMFAERGFGRRRRRPKAEPDS